VQVEDLAGIPALMKAIKLSLKFSAKTTIYLATETRFIKAVVCVPISLQLRATWRICAPPPRPASRPYVLRARTAITLRCLL
jgi:hypothetical protein